MKNESKCEWVVLQYIIQYIGISPFVWEDLQRNSMVCNCSAELKLGLIRLRQKGIVLTYQNRIGENIYMIPRDTMANWYRLAWPHIASSMRSVDNAQPLEQAILGLQHDLFHLLVSIAKQGLPLTRQGQLYKKSMACISSQLQLQAESLQYIPFYEDQLTELSRPVAVILDIARCLRLVTEDKDQIRLRTDRVRSWLSLSTGKQRQWLYKLWTLMYQPSSTDLQHFTLLLEQMPKGKWFLLDPLVQAMQENDMLIGDKHSIVTMLEDRWLKPLIGFGILERGMTTDEIPVLRFVEEIEGAAALTIQDDFEIIVPQAVPYDVRWELECIAEQRQCGLLSRYVITLKSMQFAFAHGRSSDEIMTFLDECTHYDVPSHIRFSIDQWFTYWQTEHKAPPASHAYPRVWNLTDLTEAEPWAFSGLHVATARSMELQHLLDHNDRVYDVTQPAELYPQLEHLPSIWLDQSRRYHSSTSKRLFRQAIAWGAFVKIKQDGKSRLIAPLELVEQAGDSSWQVKGKYQQREMFFSPQDWEELQLILPGINDI